MRDQPLTPTGLLVPARRGVGSGKERLNLLVLAGEAPGFYNLLRSAMELPATKTSVQRNYITNWGEKRGWGESYFSWN